MTAVDKLIKMASPDEPFNLYEPKLWKDKIGDSKWHCSLNSISGPLIERTGDTMHEAIHNCYNDFVLKYQLN